MGMMGEGVWKRGCVLRAQNMDRQFDDDLEIFLLTILWRVRVRILIHASGA